MKVDLPFDIGQYVYIKYSDGVDCKTVAGFDVSINKNGTYITVILSDGSMETALHCYSTYAKAKRSTPSLVNQ